MLTTAQAAPSCSAQLCSSQFGRARDELSRAELSRAVAALDEGACAKVVIADSPCIFLLALTNRANVAD